MQTLEGHSRPVDLVAFFPDGKLQPTILVLNDWVVECHDLDSEARGFEKRLSPRRKPLLGGSFQKRISSRTSVLEA